MIDGIFKFTDLTAAKSDPYVQSHMDQLHTLFMADRVIPGLQVWRASQDVIGTDAQGFPMVTHTFLTGWFVLVSVNRPIPSGLANHPALQVGIDVDLANSRTPGMILKNNIGGAILQDIRFSPVFAGRDFPWGNWT